LKLAAGYPDQEAHYKLMVSMITMPLYYGATVLPLWYKFGFKTSMLVMGGLLLSGSLAVRFRPLDTMRGLAKAFIVDASTTRQQITKLRAELREKIIFDEEEKKLYSDI
jgi:hypothetical protein